MRFPLANYPLILIALMNFVALGAPAPRQHLQFSTTFSSKPNGSFLTGIFLRFVDQEQFGNAHLSSDVLIDGQQVHADLAARLEYQNGTGPFNGFITLTWTNGDTLATRYVGGAERNADGSTTVTGTLAVIGGEGKYARASGRGTVLGYRDRPEVGNPVTYNVTLDVFGSAAPNSVTASGGQPTPITGGLITGGPARDRELIQLDLPLTGAAADQWFLTVESGRLRYGLERLTGQSQGTSVEMLTAFEYLDGSGPVSGYVNLTFADNSSLFCRYSGQVRLNNSGATIIDGRLQVFLGTGRYVGARGEGTFRATANGPEASLLLTNMILHVQ